MEQGKENEPKPNWEALDAYLTGVCNVNSEWIPLLRERIVELVKDAERSL